MDCRGNWLLTYSFLSYFLRVGINSNIWFLIICAICYFVNISDSWDCFFSRGFSRSWSLLISYFFSADFWSDLFAIFLAFSSFCNYYFYFFFLAYSAFFYSFSCFAFYAFYFFSSSAFFFYSTFFLYFSFFYYCYLAFNYSLSFLFSSCYKFFLFFSS